LKLHVSLIVLIAFTAVGTAQDRSLPEIIGEFRYDYPPTDYCSIGDRNGDGRDEFIIGVTREDRYEIYYGSDDMGGEYFHEITTFRENEELGTVQFIGRIMPERPMSFANNITLRNQDEIVKEIDYHTGIGEEQDSLWDTWSSIWPVNTRSWFRGPHNRPFDLNGDEFNDLALYREISDSVMAIDVYFGGTGFDSIPDWTKYIAIGSRLSTSSFQTSSGYDVNGDGYHDLFDVRIEWTI